MKTSHILFALLWLPGLAAAGNGVTDLRSQQQVLNQSSQQAQQQRQLNNQQMDPTPPAATAAVRQSAATADANHAERRATAA